MQNQEGGAGAAFIALMSLVLADASEHDFSRLSSPNLSPLPATSNHYQRGVALALP